MDDDTDLPWMKFYPSDFMGSSKVRSMKGVERGIYISLMCKCWESPGGAIPDDPGELWMECGVTPEQMRDAWPKIRECFESADREGHMVQPRIQEEREKAIERHQRAKEAWEASAEARRKSGTDKRGAEQDGQAGRSSGSGEPDGGAPLARSDASEAQSPDGQKNRDTDEQIEKQPSEDVKSSGASADGNQSPGNRWSETVTTCRKHLWLGDNPPFDRTVGQELSVAKQLTERWNLDPPEVAEAVEGFAALREQGEWSGWVEPKDPASLLALNRTPDDSQGIPVMIRSLHEVRKDPGTERSGEMERVSA